MCSSDLATVTGAEYEAIHSCWCKAIKVLPDYSAKSGNLFSSVVIFDVFLIVFLPFVVV